MYKNEIVEVNIEDIGASGEGIGKVDGFPLFIKDAIIGDRIKAKITKLNKSYGFARVEEIITPSPFRVKPRCPIARPCGGCQIQEMDIKKQLEFKEKKVFEHLKRIGGFSEEKLSKLIEPIIGMENPFNYRNKASFPFGRNKNGEIVTGFYAGRTHSIIPSTDCHIGVGINKKILEIILDYLKKNKISPYDENTGKGILRHALLRYGFKTHEIMVCLVINSNKSSVLRNNKSLIHELKKLPGMTSILVNFNTKKTNVIMGEKCETLWGRGYIMDVLSYTPLSKTIAVRRNLNEIEKEDEIKKVDEIEKIAEIEKRDKKRDLKEIENIKIQISPLSFYQVNPVQTEKLYALALEYADLKGKEVVWDLYCGIGTISLFLSAHAKKVIGVEVIPGAIADAKTNAKINGIKNVEFITGKSEEVFTDYYKTAFGKNEISKEAPDMLAINSPDVVVLDPPRKGCEAKLLDAIIKNAPKKIVYISCDSATLARDLKILCEEEYELLKVRPVDLFPMTVHCEVITLLVKKVTS